MMMPDTTEIKEGDSWVWVDDRRKITKLPDQIVDPWVPGNPAPQVGRTPADINGGYATRYGCGWRLYRKIPEETMKTIAASGKRIVYNPVYFKSFGDSIETSMAETAKDKVTKPTRIKSGADPDPGSIISVFWASYPESKKDDWEVYKPAGYVHKSELALFGLHYGRCVVSGEFYRLSFLTQTSEREWVNNREIKSGRWERCCKSGRACRKEDMIDVISISGSKIRMSKSAADSNAFRDDFDGRMYCRSARLMVSDSKKYKLISRASADSGPFVSCNNCGNIFEKDNNSCVNRTEFHAVMCNSCYDAALSKGVIKAHNYTDYPKPIFSEPYSPKLTKEAEAKWAEVMGKLDHPMKTHSLKSCRKQAVFLYGIECETEFRPPHVSGKRAKMALQALKSLGADFCIIKHDGSLSGTREPEAGEKIRRGGDFGFEIVSAPCDIATHRERWPRLETMPDYKELRAWDVGTCGLHIHVSRAPMTPLQICRISYMINHPKLKGFIQVVAGRCAARYNKFIPKKMTEGLQPDKDKYTAINVKHSGTIEFRIFRGTVNARHIIRNLEFVEAVVRYCHPGDRSLRDLSDADKFIQFTSANRKQWPEWNRWMDTQDEFKKLIKQNPGAFGPKDERTKKGEKAPEVLEINDPDQPPKPEVKKAKPEKATITQTKNNTAYFIPTVNYSVNYAGAIAKETPF